MLNQRVACDLVTNFEVAENRIEYQTENPLIFFARTENQMLKYGKSANRNEYQNQKNRSKNSQNRKTENPNAPLYDECGYLFVFTFSQMRKGEIFTTIL